VTIAADAEGSKEQRVSDAFFIVKPNRNQLMDISRRIDIGILRPVMGSVFAMEPSAGL
jgi:hypothetical protein